MEWSYRGSKVIDLPEEVKGMVYKIHYVDGTSYIGSKVVRSERRLKPLKGMRKNAVRKVVKESDWRSYTGSSKLTEGKEIFAKEILYLTTNKMSMTYLEQRELMKVDAAVNEKYLNKNIGGKFFDNCLDGVFDGDINTGSLFDE